MPAPVALITGINGQDGSYLAEFLLEKGYVVHGLRRRSSTPATANIDHLLGGNAPLTLHHGDMGDGPSLQRILERTKPDEIYNLAAQSHVGLSFEAPEQTADVDGIGVLRLLEAIRRTDPARRTRFFQASSSEMFGQARHSPQDERTPFHPRSPYGVAKLYAHWITVNHREAHGLHASSGILFNHESPRRGTAFVTRRITRAVAAIHRGLQPDLALGNLETARDWGHARDHVEGMWLMLQQERPDDYVLATGIAHTVREFTELAFREVGVALDWAGEGEEEQGRCLSTGRVLVRVDPALFRPLEGSRLVGDAGKARRELGWRPRVTLAELASDMVRADLARLAVLEPVG
jgi:GDPmannose 4,6-dehydratase